MQAGEERKRSIMKTQRQASTKRSEKKKHKAEELISKWGLHSGLLKKQAFLAVPSQVKAGHDHISDSHTCVKWLAKTAQVPFHR
jgi:hypothetical protein